MEVEPKKKRYRKKYMLVYFPDTDLPMVPENAEFIHLHSKTMKEAIKISECVFGPMGIYNLFYKTVEVWHVEIVV